jgi:hypothetical protein
MAWFHEYESIWEETVTDVILEFARIVRRKPRRSTVMIFGVPAETRTEHVPNTIRNRCHYSSLVDDTKEGLQQDDVANIEFTIPNLIEIVKWVKGKAKLSLCLSR